MKNHSQDEVITSLAEKYLYQIGVTTLSLLLYDKVEHEMDTHTPLPYPLSQELLDWEKDITDFLVHAQEVLDKETGSQEAILQASIKKREEILAAYKAIMSYSTLWRQYFSPLQNEIALGEFSTQENKNKHFHWENLFIDCENFLEESPNELAKAHRISSLLGCIPPRMARGKFLEHLETGLHWTLKGTSKNTVQSTLDFYLSMLAPKTQQYFGRYFPEVASWLVEKETLDYSNKTSQELEDIFSAFQEMSDNISLIETFFAILFEHVNSIILLCSLPFSLDELLQDKLILQDTYFALREILLEEVSSEQKEAYLDTLSITLEEWIEPTLDMCISIKKKMDRTLKQNNPLSQETEQLLLSVEMADTLFHLEIENAILLPHLDKGEPPAPQEFVTQAITGFLQKVADTLSQLKGAPKKQMMQLLLKQIPTKLTAEETIVLVQDAVEHAPTTEQKLLLATKIITVFDENGYLDSTEHTEEE